MKQQIRMLAEQAGYGRERWSSTAQFEQFLTTFSAAVVQHCTVDFYHRYLDLNSEEDITIQVQRYVEEMVKPITI